MEPLGAAASVDVTANGKPVAGRRSAPNASPMRAASPPPAGTTIVVAALSANGAPLAATTDAGIGTTRCIPRAASGGMRTGAGRGAGPVATGAVVRGPHAVALIKEAAATFTSVEDREESMR